MRLLSLLFVLLISTSLSAQSWEVIVANGNAIPRHENSAVAIGEKFYVLGGRGIKNVEVSILFRNKFQLVLHFHLLSVPFSTISIYLA